MYTRLVLVCSFPPISPSPPLSVPRANTVSSPSFPTLRLFNSFIALSTFQSLWSFSFLSSNYAAILPFSQFLPPKLPLPPSFLHSISFFLWLPSMFHLPFLPFYPSSFLSLSVSSSKNETSFLSSPFLLLFLLTVSILLRHSSPAPVCPPPSLSSLF
jgi:hypothetical protein